MESMTQPIVAGWMEKAHADLKPEERPKPAGIQTLPAYIVRNHVGVRSVEPSPSKDLFPSWYKKTNPNTRQTIDLVSNKLATDCTPARARQNAINASANSYSSDRFSGRTSGANTNEKDDVHKCEDAKPRVSLAVTGTGSNYTFTATVFQGTHPISSDRFAGKVNFLVGGNVVKSFAAGSSPSTFSHSISGLTGNQSISAEVIDSVLYDARDTKNVDFGAGANAGVINLTATAAGATTNFSWTGGTGIVAVFRVSDNQQLCSNNASASCSVSGVSAPPGTEVIARDGSNGTSSPVNVQ